VYPHGYREFLLWMSRGILWSPYVEVEAVFREIGVVTTEMELGAVLTVLRIAYALHGSITEGISHLHALPCYDWLWTLPTQIAHWRGSVGDAFIYQDSIDIGLYALYLSAFNAEYRVLVCLIYCSGATSQ
jgi:hypothetical protein